MSNNDATMLTVRYIDRSLVSFQSLDYVNERNGTKNSSTEITREGERDRTHSRGIVSRNRAKLTDSHVHRFCSRVYEL